MLITVSINKLKIHAAIGVYPEEKVHGNDFEVTVSMDLDMNPDKIISDDLSQTVNYAEVAKVVESAMNNPFDLIEAAALAIAENVKAYVSGSDVKAEKVTVNLVKLNPLVDPLSMDSASVQLTI